MDVNLLKIKISVNTLHKKFLRECYNYAKKSKHSSTHNGAVLIKNDKIILRGANVLPLGVKEIKSRFEGSNRHLYPNHAERDLLFKAAKKGLSTDKLTMAMPWLPCIACANAIISSGVKKLIIHKQMIQRTSADWVKELKNAVEILKEAKVKIVAYDGLVGAEAYMHGEKWPA